MTRSIYISAAHKSSGKTVITTGLARALEMRGHSVQGFKKGPDYIDPLWLASATGRPCWNLDFNTQEDSELSAMLATRAHGHALALIEGNKGLHDGTAVDGSNSNAAMAKHLNTPVMLVIDTRGMSRGVAPLIQGMSAFDSDVRIAGVILNQVGGARHEGKLRSVIEAYTDIPVIGAVHKNPKLMIDERHLGLIPSNETRDAESFISAAAEAMADQIDLDRFIEHAAPLETRPFSRTTDSEATRKLRIAIARDEAFGFYYADDLQAFQDADVDCVFIDTLNDQHLPDCDGLFIGGGFPETRLNVLSSNSSLRADIRQAIKQGLPAYAECGGLMYLSESIEWQGETQEMVGAIPGVTSMHDRPVGRGYVRLDCLEQHPWCLTNGNDKAPIQAHEFHHSRLTLSDSGHPYAYRVQRGHGIDGDNDGIVINNLLANYAHMRSTAGNPWVNRFVDFVRTTNHPWKQHT